MFQAALVASLALFAPAAVAGLKTGEIECPPDIENCIICKAKAFSTAHSLSKDAFLGIGAKIGLSICSADASIVLAAEAETAAKAVAEAIAITAVQCEGQGDVEGKGAAVARAQANATAIATALVEGFLSVETCNGCTAAVEILASATETAFVEAIAESSAQIESFVPKPLRYAYREIYAFQRDWVKKVLPVYVGILADVKVATLPSTSEETCKVTLAACTAAGDQGACCALTVDQVKQEISQNAYTDVTAIATVADAACELGDISDTETDAALAIGGAFAKSLSKIFALCVSTTGGDACAWASGSIEAAAEAEARAIAQAIVSVDTCDCTIDINTIAVSVQEVLVSTITYVQADICVAGEGIAIGVDFDKKIQEETVLAFSAVLAEAFADCEAPTQVCSLGATAIIPEGPTSSASCCVNVDNEVELEKENAVAIAVAEAYTLVCTDNSPGGSASAEATAVALGKVAAKVIASFDIECGATDDASYACGAGDVTIEATAKASLKAFAQAWALAIDCGDCFVEVDSVIKTVEEIFVTAVASTWGSACTNGANGPHFDLTFWEEEYKSKHQAAVASAIAEASTQPGGTCSATADACVNAAGSDAADCCTIELTTYPDSPEAADAFAAAEAEAFAGGWLCQPIDTDASATQFVKATATAWAKAVTAVLIDCTSPDNGWACYWAESSITTSAEAFGHSIASAWAGAIGGCGCWFEVDDVAQKTASVTARVTLDVLRDGCLDGGASFSEDVLVTKIVDEHLTVFANAFAEAKTTWSDADGEQCTATVKLDAGVH